MVKFVHDIGTTDATQVEAGANDIQVVDKTRPRAVKDFECCWGLGGPHTIKKGDRYVRVVYKRKDGQFESDHICFDC